MFGVGLDVRDKCFLPSFEHGPVLQSHGLHFWQYIHHVFYWGHLLEWTLESR